MVKGEDGYPITLAEEWVGKLTPWLKQLIDYLRYIPKGKGIAEAYDKEICDSESGETKVLRKQRIHADLELTGRSDYARFLRDLLHTENKFQ